MTEFLVGTEAGLHRLVPGEHPRAELAGRSVDHLVQQETAWLAILDGNELWRSEAGPWNLKATAPDDLRLNCLAVTPDRVLSGTSEARLLRLTEDGLDPVEAFDHVEGRAKWYTPWGGPPDSRSIAVDGAGDLYVNVHVGGIVRWNDGARSWQPTIDIDADVHQVVFAAGQVLAATAEGLAVSDDDGDTWTYFTDGLHGSYCRAVAVGGKTLFVSASEGHRGRRAALYRRPLASTDAFQRCRSGLPDWFGSNIDTHCLAADPSVVAFGTQDGDVYASEDGGESWDQIADGLGAVRCVTLALNTAAGGPR